MAGLTKIEWTEATWNPFVGCTHVSAGCDNCYAASLASGRLRHVTTYEGLAEGGRFNGTVRLLPERLGWPLRKRKPLRIFVNSMSDLFHEGVPDEYIARVFAVMALAPQHTFQVLTKRHGRMRSLLNSEEFQQSVWDHWEQLAVERDHHAATPEEGRLPLPNVWLGVSVESQRWADIRIPALLDTPAAVRWLSCEPLLGPVDLAQWLPDPACPHCGHAETAHYYGPGDSGGRTVGCQGGNGTYENPICGCRKLRGERRHDMGAPYANHGLHWVVTGGESGRRARPAHPTWVRSLRDQCVSSRVPFLFKQWGEWVPVVPDETRNRTQGDRVIRGDGYHWPITEPHGAEDGTEVTIRRVGKKAAGRVLDGQTWDQYPEQVPANA